MEFWRTHAGLPSTSFCSVPPSGHRIPRRAPPRHRHRAADTLDGRGRGRGRVGHTVRWIVGPAAGVLPLAMFAAATRRGATRRRPRRALDRRRADEDRSTRCPWARDRCSWSCSFHHLVHQPGRGPGASPETITSRPSRNRPAGTQPAGRTGLTPSGSRRRSVKRKATATSSRQMRAFQSRAVMYKLRQPPMSQ